MSLLRSCLEWLRGPEDAAALQQVAYVRAFEVPMLRQVLEDQGIKVEVVEGHNQVTWEPMAAVMVARDTVERAQEVVGSFRKP